jgi:hypothetical protein
MTGLIAALAIVLAACSTGATPAPVTAQPTATPAGGAIVLDRAPADTACDAIGVDYTSFTIRIDPSGNPQIWAEPDKGPTLQVKWDPTFTGGDASNPVVMDKDGTVVAEDGTVVELPVNAWAELEGHFICTGPTSIIVLDQAPQG